MTDDASRKAILPRRAKFVAAALAGITIAACKDGGPFACLKVAAPRDAESEEAPMPCLSPPMPDPDASRPTTSTTDDAGAPPSDAKPDASTPKDAGAKHVVKPHPTPKVCLKMMPPRDQNQ